MIHCLNAWFITVPKTSLTKQVLLPNAIMETSSKRKHSITTLQEEVKVKSQCLAGAWQCSSVGRVYGHDGWICPWLDALSCRNWVWRLHSCNPRLGTRKQNSQIMAILGCTASLLSGCAPTSQKNQKFQYKVSACQNYPRQIFRIAQNVQSTFSGMAHCLLCCDCHPPSLIEIRVSPRVTGGYTY